MTLKSIRYWLGLIVVFSFIVSGCDLLDQEEPIPSYLYVEETIFTVADASQGTNIQDIRDVWVSVGGQFIGIFPVPSLIPVLESGEQEVRIFPGISANGLADFRIVNPMFTVYQAFHDLNPTEIDTIRPNFAYKSDVNFLFVEDFEASNSLSQDLDNNADTKVVLTPDTALVFEGGKSGEIVLEGDNAIFEVGSQLLYEINNPTNVYMELHYRNDIDFEFGILSETNGLVLERIYAVGVFASDDWRKIYIDLTNHVRAMKSNGGEEFQILVRSFNPATNDTAYNYLDNVKLIYR